MMKMGQVVRKFARRSQSGQSIVILALGFLALLGFVGIVTDVSLMFVRFSTLTRAVDAASIAAAGQVRRQTPFQQEVTDHCSPSADAVVPPGGWTPDDPCSEAEAAAFARSFGNVGVAARQFIEFYGLQPEQVLIDMCVTVSEDDGSGNLQAIAGLEEEFTELCEGPNGDFFERKLIKVTAQIESPTVFMRLFGFPEIVLEASALSETAVLDVVVIMDVSESMLNQTTYLTWAQQGYTHVYVPPDMGWQNYYDANGPVLSPRVGFGEVFEHDFSLLGFGFQDYEPDPPAADPYPNDNWYHFRAQLAQLSPEDANALLCDQDGDLGNCSLGGGTHWSPFEVEELDYPGYTFQHETNDHCRVQYWPYSNSINLKPDLVQLYDDLGRPWTATTGSGLHRWRGYVPNYDFYRCCNDPNADGSFTDLLCQPFRDARDATELFLQRIDFLRGDRVAFVTFDREAFLVRTDRGDGVISHMIEDESVAVRTLTESIGVRAEPSFYEPQILDGGPAVPWTYVPGTPLIEQWQHRSSLLGDHDYEVNQNCPFYDAAYEWPHSPVVGPSSAFAASFGSNVVYDARTYPSLLNPELFDGNPAGQLMYPRGGLGATSWESANGYGADVSYDVWASCRGTNIGAALREASNALVDPRFSRQGDEGSVWVMVLLSDGAAGASDPVFNSNLPGNATIPADAYYPYDTANDFRVEYGGLGLCPVGNGPSSPTAIGSPELSQFTEAPWDFPYCSDEMPETRHFCFFDKPRDPLIVAGEPIRPYVNLGEFDCDAAFYDVDDYARDWADWVGLAERPDGEVLSQLPTIFTIGFGFNFDDYGSNIVCEGTTFPRDAVPDCLGEELLRYIADVGDNFQVDSDYQQALRERNPTLTGMTNDDFGPRGECEEDMANPAGTGSATALVQPLPAGESCGNYFNAPTSTELNRVFDEIASRMFTRLAQ